jgi:iron complex outermembrane receptor protein
MPLFTGPCRGAPPIGVCISVCLLLVTRVSPGAEATSPATPSGDALQEVVVTAQFRNESVQQTPLAITAINAQALAERGQTSLTEIAQDAPSVSLNPVSAAFGPSMSAYIRGIGQGDLEPALEPGVGIYVDDVYFGTLTGSLLDLLDLDRVEVLRGPQGTLEGMNSEGGAVKLFSKRPDATEKMTFDALYGSRNHVEFRGSTNFALSDTLFVRLSGVGNHQDGYQNVFDFGCANPTFTATPVTFSPTGVPTYGAPGTYSVATGAVRKTNDCLIGQQGGIGYAGGRVAIRWTPSERLDINLIGDLSNTDQENPAESLIYAGPGPLAGNASATEGALITIPSTTGALLPYDVSKVPALIPSNRYASYANYCMPTPPFTVNIPGLGSNANETAYCASARQKIQSWGAQMSVDWTLSDTLSVKNTVALRGYSSTWSEDNDESIWPVGLGIEGMDHHQFSEELRLTGSWRSLLDYTVGGFYFRELTVYPAHEDLRAVFPTLPGIFNFLQNDPTLAHDKAGYLHLIYHVTPEFDATFGARFTDQDKLYRYVRLNPQGDTGGSATLVGSLNGASAYYHADRWDWRGNLSYHLTDQAMIYGQYSTGFKGGGVDPRPYYVQQAVQFNPESLTTYEAGVKSTWFDNHLRANLDGFFSQYRNIQLTLLQCSGVGGVPAAFGTPCALPYNAGSGHEKGAELETQLSVAGFRADANLSYINFKYISLNPATGVSLSMVTPWTPQWQGGAGIQYTIPFTAGSFTARIDGTTRSAIYTNAVNGPYNRIGGYTVYNAHVMWEPPKGNWQISVQGKNITDKRYWMNVFDLASSGGGSVGGVPSPPLEVDLEIKHTM